MEKRKIIIPAFQEIKAGAFVWLRNRFWLKTHGLVSFLFFMSFATSLCFATEPAAAEQLNLDQLIREALTNNSELVSLEDRVAALELEAPYSGSLQDPVLGIALANLPVDSFELDQEAMTQKQLFISQKFPWFGTLGLRQQIAEIKAFEARSRLLGRKLEVKKQVTSLWYEINILYRSVDIITSLKDIVTQSLRIAESRYSTGKGLQQDILTGQVQLTELIREEVMLKSKIRMNLAQLAALLNRGMSFSGSQTAQHSRLEEPQLLPPFAFLLQTGINSSPVLMEKQLMVDRLKVEVKLAQAAYYPNFDLRFSYGQREDDPTSGNERADFVSSSLAMSVPLYQATRQDAKLGAAEKRLQAGVKSLEGFRRTFPHEVSRKVAEIEGLQESYQLMSKPLTVQAAHLADGSLAAYSVGKVAFDTMLSARMSLLRLELNADVNKYQIFKKIAELEQIIGVSLPFYEGK